MLVINILCIKFIHVLETPSHNHQSSLFHGPLSMYKNAKQAGNKIRCANLKFVKNMFKTKERVDYSTNSRQAIFKNLIKHSKYINLTLLSVFQVSSHPSHHIPQSHTRPYPQFKKNVNHTIIITTKSVSTLSSMHPSTFDFMPYKQRHHQTSHHIITQRTSLNSPFASINSPSLIIIFTETTRSSNKTSVMSSKKILFIDKDVWAIGSDGGMVLTVILLQASFVYKEIISCYIATLT